MAFLAFRSSIRGETNAEKAFHLAAFVASAHEMVLAPARCRRSLPTSRDGGQQQGAARACSGLAICDELRAETLRDRPEVASVARAAHDVLLVDEFQDTSRVQRDLVYLLRESNESRSVCSPGALPRAMDLDPSGLLIVGDRKQSIYGFRGADVTVFGAVAAELIGTRGSSNAELVTLSENRRSHPSILEFVNWFAEADFGRGGRTHSTCGTRRASTSCRP